jgi:hypothetical protein
MNCIIVAKTSTPKKWVPNAWMLRHRTLVLYPLWCIDSHICQTWIMFISIDLHWAMVGAHEQEQDAFTHEWILRIATSIQRQGGTKWPYLGAIVYKHELVKYRIDAIAWKHGGDCMGACRKKHLYHLDCLLFWNVNMSVHSRMRYSILSVRATTILFRNLWNLLEFTQILGVLLLEFNQILGSSKRPCLL